MYVCICHGLNDHQIKQAVCWGASRAAEVYKHFGVRPECGRCVSYVCEMLAYHKKRPTHR